MKITYLELPAKDLHAQRDFYARVLELPTELNSSGLVVRAGNTEIRTNSELRKTGFPAASFYSMMKMEKTSSSLKAGILTPFISRTRQGMSLSSSRGIT
jgi:hypothetical protein